MKEVQLPIKSPVPSLLPSARNFNPSEGTQMTPAGLPSEMKVTSYFQMTLQDFDFEGFRRPTEQTSSVRRKTAMSQKRNIASICESRIARRKRKRWPSPNPGVVLGC